MGWKQNGCIINGNLLRRFMLFRHCPILHPRSNRMLSQNGSSAITSPAPMAECSTTESSSLNSPFLTGICWLESFGSVCEKKETAPFMTAWGQVMFSYLPWANDLQQHKLTYPGDAPEIAQRCRRIWSIQPWNPPWNPSWYKLSDGSWKSGNYSETNNESCFSHSMGRCIDHAALEAADRLNMDWSYWRVSPFKEEKIGVSLVPGEREQNTFGESEEENEASPKWIIVFPASL